MSEFKGTKGEWISREVPPNLNYTPPRRRFQITNEADTEGICTVNIDSSCSAVEAEANTSLIAAAPYLLKSLQGMVDLIHSLKKTGINRYLGDDPNIINALQAIKKATT